MKPLNESPYSYHFKVLTILGAWVIGTKNKTLIKLFVVYQLFITFTTLLLCYFILKDLYLTFGDFKKLTWNLSGSTWFFLIVIKCFVCYNNCQTINKLRQDLHNDEQSSNSAEDDEVNAKAFKELKIIRLLFYVAISLIIPTWAIARYFNYLWGPPELLFPIQLPIKYNLEDNREYNYLFFSFLFLSIVGIVLVTETEISTFSILIQITREYSRLLKDIRKVNELFSSSDDSNREVNAYLRNLKVRKLIREFIIRQEKLFQYTKTFENCYNRILLIQVWATSFLLIFINIQILIISSPILISYLLVYNFITILVLFLICYLTTVIHEQCLKVGEEIYSTVWYRMKVSAQKCVWMMLIRSQHPQKITTGKIMELNLHAFMLVLRNTYSWLTLYKQLENKI